MPPGPFGGSEQPTRPQRAERPRTAPGGGRHDEPEAHPASRADDRGARRSERRGRGEQSRADRGRDRGEQSRPGVGGRLLRGLTGVLTGGFVVLTVALLVVAWVASRNGMAGPGSGTVTAHVVGALVAVGGQVVADRRRDRAGTIAAGVVLAVVVLVLGFCWFF
ncbi:hypothetical protein [Pseudonocardia phyllosphaerae]|uniref:hypothetical protein n=1 Tax=Pseudonocardia phyllosphaerae TaxID=3390502 RepID=UPI00397D9739